MLRSIRHLNISLAAKCQLLFGAAVVAVIIVALYWPWKRIEQLTQQLNQDAASAVSREIIGRHIESWRARLVGGERLPTTLPGEPTRMGPTAEAALDGHEFVDSRLVGVGRLRFPSGLTRFELG